jgi:hypothetical protein
MEEALRERIIDVLARARSEFKHLDATGLINTSDLTIHFASLEQDPNATSVAVMVYCLAKIVERRAYRETKGWEKFTRKVLGHLESAEKALIHGNENSYVENVKAILKTCGQIDHKFSKHITEVIISAKVKKGSDVYRQGISLGQAAEMMGITPWELRDYVGHTRIADIDPLITKTAKRRIKEARRIFGLE